MEKKQSSIDWLLEQLIPNAMRMFDATICNAIEKAKAMHKEEIIDAVNFGDKRGKITTYSTVEQYYHETFDSASE